MVKWTQAIDLQTIQIFSSHYSNFAPREKHLGGFSASAAKTTWPLLDIMYLDGGRNFQCWLKE